MIKATGQWPMLEGNNWNESDFDLKRSIQNFRKYISKSDEDIFESKINSNEVSGVKQELLAIKQKEDFMAALLDKRKSGRGRSCKT